MVKKYRSLLDVVLLFVLLALVACNAADQSESEAETDSGKVSVADCPEAKDGAHQLIDAARGICLLYPDYFDVFEHTNGSGYTLYVRSLLNQEAPSIWLYYEPANGRSLEEVTAQRLTDYAFPDAQSQSITLGNEPASMLDNLPGQDTNRRIVVLHDDRVIDIIISHIGKSYGAAGEQAEAAYNMIINSFQFIGIEPDAPLLAGPECPELVENSTLYTNEVVGYCLLLPADYLVQEANPEAGENEMAFYVGTLQDVSHARLSIKVTDANGLSLEEATTAHRAEIEEAMPGFEVAWSFGYMLDGVAANQIDQAPGQDLSRQVIMVREGRLYTLTFIPDDPEAGQAYKEMETVYNMVMDSFSFLRQS